MGIDLATKDNKVTIKIVDIATLIHVTRFFFTAQKGKIPLTASV